MSNDTYPDHALSGEPYVQIERLMHVLRPPWNVTAIAGVIKQYEAAPSPGDWPDGWPNWVSGNHDRPSLATRVGGIPQARLAAMLLLTLRGTPAIYNGDELGMQDVPNVEVESQDDTSLLSLYRDLLLLRQLEPALTMGAYREIRVDGDLLVYERLQGHQRFVIALNFGSGALSFDLRSFHLRGANGVIAASTNPERPIGEHNVEESEPLATTLGSFEGIIIRVT